MSTTSALRRRTQQLWATLDSPWWFGAGITVVAGILFVPFARLGVDPHHDGIMFTSAHAVAKGLNVQSQVYAQYGPISTWLQGLELLLFGDRLLTIRVASSIVLAVATGLFAVAGRRVFDLWTMTVAIGAWLACTPFFDSDLAMIPWSSDYYLLSTAICAVIASSPFWKRDPRRQAVSEMIIGGILAAGLFLRLNPAVPVLVLVIAAAMIYQSFAAARNLMIGAVTSSLLVLFGLHAGGGVGAWWEQAVTLPGKMYSGILTERGAVDLQGNVLINGVPALLGVIIVFYFVTWVVPRRVAANIRSLSGILVSMAAVAFTVWLFLQNGTFQLLNPRLFLWGIVLAAGVFLPILVSRLDNPLTVSFQMIVLVSVGIGSLTQVVPIADRRHLWWATLPALIILASLMSGVPKIRSKWLGGLIVVTALAVPAFFHARETLSVKRVEVAQAAVLRGMLVSPDFRAAFGSSFSLIKDFEAVHGDRSVINLCADGLYASLGATYDYPDPLFVDWAFPASMWSQQSRTKFVRDKEPLMWLCWPQVDPASTARTYRYRLVRRPECLAKYERFSTWHLSGQLAVPKDWPLLPQENDVANSDVCRDLALTPDNGAPG